MSDSTAPARPAWFDACIIGCVFASILLSASIFVGFGTFLLNLVALGCFAAPIVMAVREGEVRTPPIPSA